MTNLISVPIANNNSSQSLYSRIRSQYKSGLLFWTMLSFARRKISRAISGILMRFAGINGKPKLSNLLVKQTVSIIDVGAADGYHPRWNQFGENLRITLFEPEDIAYKKLVAQYKTDERVKCVNKALSETGGEITINITAWPRASSAYEPDMKHVIKSNKRDLLEVKEKINVGTVRLDDICQESDFIKMDVEGYELPVLKGSGKNIETCIGLEIEVNYNDLLKKCPVYSEVDLFMRKKGFVLVDLTTSGYNHYILPSKNLESKGIISSADALFFRLPENVVELIKSGKWERKKIVIAASIYLAYGNYEFAYILIKEAVSNGILGEDDSQYLSIYSCIRNMSGLDKFVSLRTIKRIENFFSGN